MSLSEAGPVYALSRARRGGAGILLLLLLVVIQARSARAFVVGKAPAPISTHTIFGSAQATGATLMLPGPSGAEIRSVLLPNASAAFSTIPADAVLVKAYLFWTGSLAQDGVVGPKVADPTVSLTMVNGASASVTAPAGACTTVVHPTYGTLFPPFYYCRADVTAQVAPNKLGGTYNGNYIVGSVAADPGHVDASGQCTEAQGWCQAKYAAWSMVLIYSSPSEPLLRDIHLYDGFLAVDHQDGPNGSLGVTSFTIAGFLADTTPQATLSYFAVETDVQLGMPPQDQYPPGSPNYCATCQDYVKLNGTTLVDERGWPGNIFNESMGIGSGVDIDSIEVGNLIAPGATSATIEVGSGTGPILATPPSSGGGELIGFGWTLLTLRRPAPNLKGPGTSKSVNPLTAGQGETVAYTVNVANTGSIPATGTTVTDTLPALVNYKPGSLQLGGVACTDAADGDPCTVSGKTITVSLGTLSHLSSPPPGNTRQIAFLASVAPSALNGQTICNLAQVSATGLGAPYSPPAACFTVKAPELATPQKTVIDLNGGVIGPEDILQFTVTIPAKGTGPVSGISFSDEMPPFLRLLTVIAPPGSTNSSTLTGGVNGTGLVQVSGISIPAGSSSTSVTILARLASEAEFGAGGVTPGQIEGQQVCNQGSVSAAFLPTPLQTDDPAVVGSANPTCVAMVYSPKLGTSSKLGVDLNGAQLEPGDTLRYTLSFVNTGNRPATLNVTDELPPQTGGFTLVGTVPGASYAPPPAGANGTGRLTVSGLAVPAGATRTVVFEVTVSASASHGQSIQNCAAFAVPERPSEGKTICSAPLSVYAIPDLEGSTKTVTDLNGGQAQPGDTLRYTLTVANSGNRPATGVVVTDVVSTGLTNVVPLDGGSWNATTRTITWNPGTVAAKGGSASLRFEARIVVPTPNGTALCNQGNVASVELPVEPTNNPATPQNDDPTCLTVVSAPELGASTKTVVDLNGAPTRPGDTLRYTIVARNDGNEVATGVVVRDVVSTLLEQVVPQDGGIWNPATRTITWSIASLAPGAQATVRFEARVVTPLPNGTTIANQAFLTATQVPAPGTPTDNPATPALDDPTIVTVTSAANLGTSEKTVLDVNGGVPQPGDVLAYTVRLRNTGDAPARATIVSDVVSTNLTAVVPQDGGSWNAATRTVSWPAADVVPGTDRLLRFQATVVLPLANGTVVCNQASAVSADLPAAVLTDNPATPAVDDPTCVTVESKPDLGASVKTVVDLDGGKIEPGDQLSYSIKVDNIGTQNATGVTVTDVVATTLTGVVPQDGGVWNATTRTITWSVGTVAAKSSQTVRFTAQIVLPLDDGTKIANQATITATGIPIPTLSDDPATAAPDDPTVVTVSAAPSFKSSQKAVLDVNGGIVEPGDALSYTLTIVNSGTSVADKVVVTDLLDPSLDFVSAGQGGSYNAATRVLTWSSATTPALAKLALGASAAVTLSFNVTVKSPLKNGTQVCNQGLVASEELALPDKTDNPATPVAGDATCLTVVSAPDFANASKTVADGNGAPVRPGDALTYTLSLPNTGNAPATGVVVTDVIDPGLENVVPGQGGSYNPATRTIVWTPFGTPALASVAAGTTVTLSFTATVMKPLDNGTKIVNQAAIISPELPLPVLTDDPATPAIDDVTLVTVVAAPILTGSQKTVVDGNGGEVEPGDTLTWTITLRNSGDAIAKGVTVTDLVDLSLTNVTPLDGGVYDAASRTITWTVGQVGLTPGGDVAVRFSASVVSPLKNATLIKNQGSIAVPGLPATLTDDPKTPAPADPTTVTVVSKPNLGDFQKSVAGGTPQKKVGPGTLLVYTLSVPNTGTEDAANVVVRDAVSTSLEAVSPLDGGVFDPATRTITWTIASLKVGQTVTLRFEAKVRADVKNGELISNQAFAEVTGLRGKVASDDPSTQALDDPTNLQVEAVSNLTQFTKSVVDQNGGEVVPGDTLEYTLKVRNTGTAYAFAVKVVDPLPSSLESVQVGQGGTLSANGTITWDGSTTAELAKLAPGVEVTLTFTAKIRVPTANGTLISNQAVLTAEGGTTEPSDDPSTPQLNDPTTLKVTSAPRLGESEKRVIDVNGGLVKPNDVLEYVIRVINKGTGNAVGATLVDTIPTHTVYLPGTTFLNGSLLPDSTTAVAAPTASGILVSSPGAVPGQLNVGEDQAAEVRFRVRVRGETQEGAIITNQGLVRSTQTPLEGTDDPATPQKGDPTQVVVGKGPNLSGTVKVFAPKPIPDPNSNGLFDLGEAISYTVTIPNTGTARATGVVFSDGLDPAGRAAYVAGSLTLNGAPLSDASDGDAGSVSGNQLRVVVGSIDPGKAAVVAYQARILTGPRVENQGTVRSSELQPELTDADGNDANGDSPTVVPVAGWSTRALRGQKTVLDVNGGDVRPGDELLYTITIFNDSSIDEAIDVGDHIPAGALYAGGSAIAPPGASVAFDPPPAGSFGRGRLRVAGIKVKAGGSAVVLLRAILDSTLVSGSSVCNTAQLGAGGGLDLQTPLDAGCVLVGSPVGTGGLSGTVYRDLGEDNRRLDTKDQRLAGFQVQAFLFGNPNGTPAAAAVSDDQGYYRLASLPPGPYTLRILSAKGTQLGSLGAVTVPAGQAAARDLPVDPSGIVYEATTGAAVAGAQLYLHYDATDTGAPGALVPPALLGVGQQGQVTDGSGFYRFDLQAGRRYQLKLQPLSPSLQFPSSLVPATPGFAQTSGPEHEVVPDDLPDPKREGARLTYYLRFKVDGAADEVFNNHIPLDPMTSLIRLEKRADRRRASLGDLVTYTVSVENRSTREFLLPGSQVGIEDLLPAGLRLVVGSAHRVRRTRAGSPCVAPESASKDADGATACVARAEPTAVTGRVLRFGPLPLGAGESIRLVYRVAIGLDTRQGEYRNRAVLKEQSFASDLSNTGEAIVLVEADPDLDQGLLLGKVFCDRDADGRQGPGEHGLAGVRVYLDNGSYSVTDSTGKYHLRNIKPGLHLVKLDSNTLRAGSRLTTDESRVIDFTRGLPAKVNFGASCQENWVAVQKLELKPPPTKKKAPAGRKPVVPALSLAGDALALKLSVDRQPAALLEAELALSPAGKGAPRDLFGERRPVALELDTKGHLRPALVFHLKSSSRGASAASGWFLTVSRLDPAGRRETIRRFSGSGTPPLQLRWDGTLAGKPILAEALYQAQLELTGFSGEGGSSALRRFVVGRGARALPGPAPADPPSAFLDGVPLTLDANGRFATTIGRVAKRPPLLELRRGDGKGVWLAIGGASVPVEDDGPERVKVEGNLSGPTLSVDGKPVDATLLTVGLLLEEPGAEKEKAASGSGENLPRLGKDGKPREAILFKPLIPAALLRRWTLRIEEAAGKRARTLGALAGAPTAIAWDGNDDAGAPMLVPGGAYLARLTVEDAQGATGQSAPLVLRAPAAVAFRPLKLEARQLFVPKSGRLDFPHRRRLGEALRLVAKRPTAERYRLTVRVAPPVSWQSERWAGHLQAVREGIAALFKERGVDPARCELTVGAVPLPSAAPAGEGAAEEKRPARKKPVRIESLYLDAIPPPPVVPATAVPHVLCDGEALKLKDDGSFSAWVKVTLGSALLLDLKDSLGRRAVILYPTKPRTRIPAPPSSLGPRSLPPTRVAGQGSDPPSTGVLTLRMRNGEQLEITLAQVGPAPAAPGAPPASVPAAPASTPARPRAPSASGPTAPPPGPSPLTGAPASKPTGPTRGARPFGAAELEGAFGVPSPARKLAPKIPAVPAAQLSVDLPPRGAILKSHELAVRGKTHPENTVTVNGAEVRLEEGGSFTTVTKLPDGKSELEIRARDRAGNLGTIRWPVEVSDRALFLMALAEGAVGQVGVELDGGTEHSRIQTGPVMLQGRAVVYLKGRIQGRKLFKQLFVTAHVDTAKQREFEEFFDQVIDPNRYYPVYGDSSTEVRDVNARDKYYLLVEVDRSSLLVGNFNAGVKGVELLRYDRTLYGAKLDFDKKLFSGKLRQQVKAFVSRDDARLARDHNILRATGGSIYYLRHGQVLVGSERINLVVRERATGLLLATLPKARDLDYVIDYGGGRIMFKSPVPSIADASFGVSNPAFTFSTAGGHPVYLEIDYEYERADEQGSGSWGVQVKDTLFDVLTLGASYVNEDRNPSAGASYRLYGGELQLRHGKATSLTGEFARSESFDVQNYISEDGGISYLGMNHVALLSGDARAADSNAYLVRGNTDLSDFFKRLRPEAVKLAGYFSRQDRGFFSDGTILEQGRTKYGGSVEWGIGPDDRISLRHDGAIALLPQIGLPGSNLDPLALREIESELTRARYEMRRGRFGLQAEYAHSYLRDPLVPGFDSHRDSLGVMGSLRVTKWLRVSLGQDSILHVSGNDPQLGSSALGLAPGATGDWRDRLMTTVGATLTLWRGLELELAESVRWSGDNATAVGLKLPVSKTASVYVRQLLSNAQDQLSTTSVVGAEDRFGPSGGGRTYGEYQIESGVLGVQNRAILGLSQTWTPWRGIGFTGGYEHQQVFGGHLPDGTPTGDAQRDVVHLGVELTRFRRLKLSTRAELRYDNGSGVLGLSPDTAGAILAPNVDTRPGLGAGYYADRTMTPGSGLMPSPGQRWQVVSRTGASWALSRDLTLLGRVNLYRTYNTTEERVEAQALELGFGAALRPIAWDWLNVLFKYTRLLEMRPLSLTEDLAQRRTYDILSIVPIVELPFRFQLVEKFAWKRVEEDHDLLAGTRIRTVVHTLLWINRLNFHLTGRIDAGVEYRFLRLLLDGQGDQLRHGALVELGYWLHKTIRLGAGYNFSSFSDNEFADQDRDASGFFFRVVGRY